MINKENYNGIFLIGDIYLNDKAPSFRENDPYIDEVFGKLKELFIHAEKDNLLPVIIGEISVKKFDVIVFSRLIDFFATKEALLIETPKRKTQEYTTAKLLSRSINNVDLIKENIFEINIKNGEKIVIQSFIKDEEHVVKFNKKEVSISSSLDNDYTLNPVGRFYKEDYLKIPCGIIISDEIKKISIDVKDIIVDQSISEQKKSFNSSMSEFADAIASIEEGKGNDWAELIDETAKEHELTEIQKNKLTSLYDMSI